LGLPLGNLFTGSSNLVLQKGIYLGAGKKAVCLASPASSPAYRYAYFKKSSTTLAYPDAVHLTAVHFRILESMPVLKYCMGTGSGLKRRFNSFN
jgi:hypothetical protein